MLKKITKQNYQHNIYLPSYEDVKISHLIVTFTENTVNFIKKIKRLTRAKLSMVCIISNQRRLRYVHIMEGFYSLKINRRLLIFD
jgi:hypothetical protein